MTILAGYKRAYKFSESSTPQPPIASSVSVDGTVEVDQLLDGLYTYTSPQGTPESGTTYQWYYANDAVGTGQIAIDGEVNQTCVPGAEGVDLYIAFEVTPSDGTLTGAAVLSAWAGPVAEAAALAPVASAVGFTGTVEVGSEVTGTYTYFSAQSTPESGSTFQWYSASDAIGTDQAAIMGATADTFTITASEEGLYLAFEVTPSDGTLTGSAVLSAYDGPVTAAVAQFIVATYAGASPYIVAYEWDDSAGFGAKLTDPGTALSQAPHRGNFSNAGDMLAISQEYGVPAVYAWSAGFGTKFSGPATYANGQRDIIFSPADDFIAMVSTSAPRISAYPWSGAGFGTKLADPASIPNLASTSIDFTNAGTAVAMAGSSVSPYVAAWAFSGSGFGSKFSDPSTAPTGDGQSVAFSKPSDSAVLIGHWVSPFLSAYPWSGSGFGTKFANPATLPSWICKEARISADESTVVVAMTDAPGIIGYAWNPATGLGTKFANPATGATGSSGNTVRFSTAGGAAILGDNSGTYNTPQAWAVTTTAFGTKYAAPASMPASGGTRGIITSP